jgi:phage baseplate assembly protein gpV
VNSSSLGGITAGQFLRSDTSDNYTSGTLTFDAVTSLDINSTNVSIADNDIAFDGASTTFTSTGAMTLSSGSSVTINPANNQNLNINLAGSSNFNVETNRFVVVNNGNVGIKDSSPDGLLDINGSLMLNGSLFSVGALGQGSLLVAKSAGNISELTKGTNHYVLKVNGNALKWETDNTGTGSAPGGLSGNFQYNNSGSFGGSDALNFNSGTKTLSVASDAPLDINSTTLSIADTDISFDGTNTTFTQTSVSGTGNFTFKPKEAGNVFIDVTSTSITKIKDSSTKAVFAIDLVNANKSPGGGMLLDCAPGEFGTEPCKHEASINFQTNGNDMFLLGYENNGKLFKIGDEGGLNTNRFVLDTNGKVGIGTLSLNDQFTINGVFAIRETSAPSSNTNFGKFYVSSSNSKPYFMNSSGVSISLTNGSSFTSSDYLRSNATTTYSSGTLTIASGTTFDVNSTNVSFADTEIELDGGATTINGNNAITLFPNSNSNLNIRLDGTSDFIVDTDKFSVLDTGNVGVGNTNPNSKLTVNGSLALLEGSAPSSNTNFGKFYINSSDSKAYFMNDSGVSFSLTNGSSFDANNYLRSNANTTYSSGTITFNSGTTVDIDSTNVSIADTDLNLDGGATTINGNNAITLFPNSNSNLNIRLDGTSDFIVDTDKLVVLNTGNVGILTSNPGANLSINGDVAFIPSSVQTINNTVSLTPTKTIMRVKSNGGAKTMSANPQIADGTDGQILILKGDSDTDTLMFDHGSGLKMTDGVGFTLGNGDILQFIYDATDDEWIEMLRSNK